MRSVCRPQRFDVEQNQAQAEVQRERSQREKLAREKDMFAGELFNLRQQLQVRAPLLHRSGKPPALLPQSRCALSAVPLPPLQDKDMEVSTANLKLQQLEAEVQDLSSQESKDEASLAKVKKQHRDLEAKVKDQEEELDEQAGSIQMLEQVLPSPSAAEKHFPLARSC